MSEPVAAVPLRRNRDFVLFWSSQVVSTVGSRASAVAFPLLVLDATGSPAQAGLVGFAGTLPFLVFFLPAGVVVDRADRKRIMLACEIARFVVMAMLVASLVFTGFVLWIALAAAPQQHCLISYPRSRSRRLWPRIRRASRVPTSSANQWVDMRSHPTVFKAVC